MKLKNKNLLGMLKVSTFSVLALAFCMPAFAGGLRHVKEILVAPPNLPAHNQIAKGGPVIIDVALTTIEKNWVIDGNGTQISGMTYNGTNPGPIIVAHVGDYLQLTLTNPKTSLFAHNIDLHAATGELGSAHINKVKPGESVTVRFKMIKSGIFTYHCAPGGENDFYIPKDKDGNYKKYNNAQEAMGDTLEVMRGLIPTHMGFGGKAFAYTGKNALTAKVGDNVLILHSQANNVSSPHLIGGHADYVWIYGGFKSPPVRDLQTWFIPAGGAVAAMYKFKYPGLYVYLNHNIIKAVMLGAALHFHVSGKPVSSDLMQVIKKQHAI